MSSYVSLNSICPLSMASSTVKGCKGDECPAFTLVVREGCSIHDSHGKKIGIAKSDLYKCAMIPG